MLFSAKEKILKNFKCRLYPVKKLDKTPTREPTAELAAEPTKHKKSKLKLQQEFMNEIIANEQDISDEIFWNYFKHQNPSISAISKYVNDRLID